MAVKQNSTRTGLIGTEPPLTVDRGRTSPPDTREISVRWLSGTVLTGLTSIILMGGALLVALDGQETLAKPFQTLAETTPPATNRATARLAVKSDRLTVIIPEFAEKQIMRISTITKHDDANVVRIKPFARVSASLAPEIGEQTHPVPPFDPLAIFSDSVKFQEKGGDDTLYAAKVEGEVKLKTSPLTTQSYENAAQYTYTDADIQRLIGTHQPVKTAATNNTTKETDETAMVITTENVSIAQKSPPREPLKETITIEKPIELAAFLIEQGNQAITAETIKGTFSDVLGETPLNTGQSLQISYAATDTDKANPARISLYDSDIHIATIARKDNGAYIKAPAPQITTEQEKNVKKAPRTQEENASRKMPSIYRALYATGLKHSMSESLIRELLRIYSFELDFRAPIRPEDSLRVFYSLDEETEKPGKNSEILYTSIKLGGNHRRFYRFKTSDDGVVDYYDEEGRSAKKFLMRKPITKARFGSRFGMRRHPITGRLKLHRGTDWSAPRGTPILAAGNGTIVEARWNAGYGRFIKIKHANGYVTHYAHMSRIASNIQSGTRVRQGQIIGYVGSTGLSTGPHLHYEVLVNNKHVDPMRIRLPRGRVLKGDELAQFEKERDRIDQLLNEDERDSITLAQAQR